MSDPVLASMEREMDRREGLAEAQAAAFDDVYTDPCELARFVAKPRGLRAQHDDGLFFDLWRACFPEAWVGLGPDDAPDEEPSVGEWEVALAGRALSAFDEGRLETAVRAALDEA